MKKKYRNILIAIFAHPVPSGIRWTDALAALRAYGAEFEEGTGSAVTMHLNDFKFTMHRPHPENEIDKGAIAALRKFLDERGIRP